MRSAFHFSPSTFRFPHSAFSFKLSAFRLQQIILLLSIVVFLESSCKSSKQKSSSTKPPSTKEKKSSAAKSSDKVEKVIKTARSYVGTPYKYGGTSRAGMDCSGLVCSSYKTVEIALPRTAQEQSTFGKTVNLQELSPGDLVFFTDKKGNKKITHVGMVTTVASSGQVKFIHASTKLGVVETDLFSDYYKPLIIKAVRIF